MILHVHDDNGEIRKYEINERNYKKTDSSQISFIGSDTKESNILKFIESFYSESKAILYDKSNKTIEEKLNSLDLDQFLKYDFSFIYFTSGTTGSPAGALKTKENLLSEIKQLSKLLEKYNIKKIVVTVPFIHFYGSLIGALYGMINDIDIHIKEHFLPNDLLDMCDDNTMVVTTPLYIKSLNKVQRSEDLSKSLFVSSTAPLFPEIAKEFKEKFNTDVMQIFGSTETGGIAYKYNDEAFWTPVETVNISQNEEGELKVTSPFVSNIVFEDTFKETNGSIQTFDYIEIKDKKFKLIGRSSQIIKIAGKRYSTLQIENILEEQSNIEKAVVFVTTNKDALRGEELNITLQTKDQINVKDIKSVLKKNLSNIRFNINLKIVEKIKTTSVGKKMLI